MSKSSPPCSQDSQRSSISRAASSRTYLSEPGSKPAGNVRLRDSAAPAGILLSSSKPPTYRDPFRTEQDSSKNVWVVARADLYQVVGTDSRAKRVANRGTAIGLA